MQKLQVIYIEDYKNDTLKIKTIHKYSTNIL